METSKQTIRSQMRQRRNALPRPQVLAAGEAVARRVVALREFARADALLAYAAAGNEVPTEPLIAAARAAGKSVYLPRLAPEGVRFAPFHRGDVLAAGALGMREPPRPAAPLVAQRPLILVPLLAFDRSGTRVGRGGGHYDRASLSWPAGAWRLGLAYDFQECAALPRDPWDAPLDMVVTESRVLRCRAAAPVESGGAAA